MRINLKRVLTLNGMGFFDDQMYGGVRNPAEYVFDPLTKHFMLKWHTNDLK